MIEQKVKRQRKTKKIIFKSKKEFGKGSFIYDVRKNSKFWINLLPLYLQTSTFGLSTPNSWTSLIGIQPPPSPMTLDDFGISFENFDNGINIVTYSFFFAKAHSIYYSHIYYKSDRKATPSQLLSKANVPSVSPL